MILRDGLEKIKFADSLQEIIIKAHSIFEKSNSLSVTLRLVCMLRILEESHISRVHTVRSFDTRILLNEKNKRS